MRRLTRTLAIGFLAALTTFGAASAAQQPAPKPEPVAAPAPIAEPRPALWKVSDADTTIYLFGTVHALPAGVRWLSGPIETALAGSQQLVTEIPETAPADMQAAMMSNAVLPQGETLRALLPADDKAKLEAALTGFGLPVEAFDRFEPWWAAVALTTLPLARDGYSAENGVEETISTAAKKLGKPRIGLETAAYQLALFDHLPRDVQLGYLREVIKGLPTINEELAGIVREWSTGNAEKLAELLNDDEDDPRMVTALLTGRNRIWAGWIKDRMKQPGTVFMAVGAGHLAGKDSVQDMLAHDGLVAQRIQ